MRKKFKRLILSLFLIFPVLLIFRTWFGFGEISAGDAAFYFKDSLNDLTFSPFIWDNTRLGQFRSVFYSFPYLFFPLKVLSSLNIPWVVTERIVWYWPFIALSIFSSWYLSQTLFPKNVFWFFGSLVFLFNPYILMIIGGGQISIALAYAISPLMLAIFARSIQNIKKGDIKFLILSGLVLGAQVSFEARIAMLVMATVLLYSFFKYRFEVSKYVKTFFIPLLIAVGIHFYWLAPTILLGKASYSTTLTSPDWVSFLSFAQFSNTFSLLHPLWPENIFGKISFMRWEFLMIPIIAYASLLFIGRTLRATNKERITTNNILFFALLGLIGAFLAKGSNPPFREVYLWFFSHVPGMSLFRDPTKFYVLVALSYSVLIPFSLEKISEKVAEKVLSIKYKVLSKNINLPNTYFLILTPFLIFWLFLIRPAVFGQLNGTLKSREVPQEYVKLKDFISSQPEFFRTFWVPQKHRFGFYSNSHPALSANEFVSPGVCQPPLCALAEERKKPPKFDPTVTSETEILEKVRDYSLSYFNHPQAPGVLAQMGVKYVIIPSDLEGEIFLRDRKYSQEEREKYVEVLNNVPWLKRLNVGDKIAVYEVSKHRDHFFAVGDEPPVVKWEMINPTKYEVEVKNAIQPFTLVFSETYDDLWQAKIEGEVIPSEKIYDAFSSFAINKKGDFNIVVEFTAQKYVWWGGIISVLTIAISLFLLLRKKR